MLKTKAVFEGNTNNFEPMDCVIEKTIRLSAAEYDSFAANMLWDYNFIRDNVQLMRPDRDGVLHCLLVVGEDRQDGILVSSSGSDIRYSAFIPNAADLLQTQNMSPSLARLNEKINAIADSIYEYAIRQGTDVCGTNLEYYSYKFGIDLDNNSALAEAVAGVVSEKPGVCEAVIHDGNVRITGRFQREEMDNGKQIPAETPGMSMDM